MLTFDPKNIGPLDGIRVLDLSRLIAGNMLSLQLADFGAEVIKIEPPEGDVTRHFGKSDDGVAGFYLQQNIGKRNVCIDLKADGARELVLELCKEADMLVENFRPGVMGRLGLGYEALAAIKPSLVYCSISGFGNTGPDAAKGGFDLVAQGVSGLMSITGHPEMPPAKVGVPITDISAGILAANGILCAYIHALKTGQGQQVDTSLMEAGVAYTVWESSVYFADGEIPGPLGSAHRVSAPYQALRTKDGYLNIGAATQPTWEQLCRAIGQEALIDDPRFKVPGDRKARQDELASLLEETFTTDTTENWLKMLEEAGVVAGPIYNMDQVYKDPQVLARKMLVDLEDPDLGTIHNIGIPVKLSATPGQIRTRAPMLGEHSTEVLLERGFSKAEVGKLVEAGVVVENQGPGTRR